MTSSTTTGMPVVAVLLAAFLIGSLAWLWGPGSAGFFELYYPLGK